MSLLALMEMRYNGRGLRLRRVLDVTDAQIKYSASLAARLESRHGTPKQNPRFWREVSPRTYAQRVRAPVLVHHGTADGTCPIEWVDESDRALKKSGADVTYRRYPGEGHAVS